MTFLVVASIHPSAVNDNLLAAVAPPLVGAPFLPSTVDGNIQKVCPRTQPCHRTGRHNIPRAPSSSIEVPRTHPNLLPGGLSTPTSCWHEQPRPVARWCCHLRPPRRHHILPPLIPLHSMMDSSILCVRTFSSSMEAIATQVPPESYLLASSTLRSQSIYWMGLGVQGLLVCFWYISLEAFFLLFFLSNSQLIVGFSSFGSFA